MKFCPISSEDINDKSIEKYINELKYKSSKNTLSIIYNISHCIEMLM